jgi:cytochrome c553
MRRLLLLTIAAPLAITSLPAQGTDSTANAGKSVWQGVYTDAEATRGDAEHQNNCTACHGTEKYSGDAFVKAWVGRTAFDLFDQLKTTMPDDNPGGLSAQQYKDIVAYIFKVNGMPAGTDSLPGDPEALRHIKIDAKPDKQTSSALLRPMYHPHPPILPKASR